MNNNNDKKQRKKISNIIELLIFYYYFVWKIDNIILSPILLEFSKRTGCTIEIQPICNITTHEYKRYDAYKEKIVLLFLELLKKLFYLYSFLFQNGSTPLHLACQASETDTVELLIAKGADYNCLNNVRHTYVIQYLILTYVYIVKQNSGQVGK